MGMLRIYLVILIALFVMAPVAGSKADDHPKNGKHFQSGLDRMLKGSSSHGGGDHGNETTGQMVLWLLVAANLTVVTSVLIKTANRLLPIRDETKTWLNQINQTQKKYLMKFHYFLNPGILAIAILHWSLSRCSSTYLPEWGLISMLILAGTGLLMKFRLAPQKFTKLIYKIHTHPGVLTSVGLVLLAGHLIVD
jgi:hypothetical protein